MRRPLDAAAHPPCAPCTPRRRPSSRACRPIDNASNSVGAELFARWHELNEALALREHAIAARDRIERDLVTTVVYPRVRLPLLRGTGPTYAADPGTIDCAFGRRHHRLRRRLRRSLARRQCAWDQAADAAGLPQAMADEDAAFTVAAQATLALSAAPAPDLAGVRLKLAVVVATGEPGPAECTAFPWAQLRVLLADLDRLVGRPRPAPNSRKG